MTYEDAVEEFVKGVTEVSSAIKQFRSFGYIELSSYFYYLIEEQGDKLIDLIEEFDRKRTLLELPKMREEDESERKNTTNI